MDREVKQVVDWLRDNAIPSPEEMLQEQKKQFMYSMSRKLTAGIHRYSTELRLTVGELQPTPTKLGTVEQLCRLTRDGCLLHVEPELYENDSAKKPLTDDEIEDCIDLVIRDRGWDARIVKKYVFSADGSDLCTDESPTELRKLPFVEIDGISYVYREHRFIEVTPRSKQKTAVEETTHLDDRKKDTPDRLKKMPCVICNEVGHLRLDERYKFGQWAPFFYVRCACCEAEFLRDTIAYERDTSVEKYRSLCQQPQK